MQQAEKREEVVVQWVAGAHEPRRPVEERLALRLAHRVAQRPVVVDERAAPRRVPQRLVGRVPLGGQPAHELPMAFDGAVGCCADLVLQRVEIAVTPRLAAIRVALRQVRERAEPAQLHDPHVALEPWVGRRGDGSGQVVVERGAHHRPRIWVADHLSHQVVCGEVLGQRRIGDLGQQVECGVHPRLDPPHVVRDRRGEHERQVGAVDGAVGRHRGRDRVHAVVPTGLDRQGRLEHGREGRTVGRARDLGRQQDVEVGVDVRRGIRSLGSGGVEGLDDRALACVQRVGGAPCRSERHEAGAADHERRGHRDLANGPHRRSARAIAGVYCTS